MARIVKKLPVYLWHIVAPYKFTTQEELINIDFVKRACDTPMFKQLSIAKNIGSCLDYSHALMVELHNKNPKIVGYIDDIENIDLPLTTH